MDSVWIMYERLKLARNYHPLMYASKRCTEKLAFQPFDNTAKNSNTKPLLQELKHYKSIN